MFDPAGVPIFINVRDRLTPLRQLVAWLEHAGQENIILIDNDSTYPPLLDYLGGVSHRVVRLGRNLGSRAIFAADLAPTNEPFVYTDPDIVPCDDCPLDAVGYLGELLDRYPQFPKAGLGLYLDDVPESVSSLPWERHLVSGAFELEPGVHGGEVMVDTTFALHRPGTPHVLRGVRTGAPYLARHLSWYCEREPSDEDRYYLQRAVRGPLGSSWAERCG